MTGVYEKIPRLSPPGYKNSKKPQKMVRARTFFQEGISLVGLFRGIGQISRTLEVSFLGAVSTTLERVKTFSSQDLICRCVNRS